MNNKLTKFTKKGVASLAKRNNLFSIVDQALVSIGNFAVTVLLARSMDLYTFGIYGIYLIAVFFFLGIQGALIVSPLYTFFPKIDDRAEQERYASAVFFMNLASAVLFALLSCLFLLSLDHFNAQLKTAHIAYPAALTIFARLMQEYARKHFFAHREAVRATKVDFTVFFLQVLCIGLAGADHQLRLEHAFWLLSATYAVGVLYGLLLRPAGRVGLIFLKKAGRRHWKFSKWLVGGAILSAVIRDYVIFNAGLLLSPVAVGQLRAAERLGGLIGVIIQIMENVLPVKASLIHHLRGNAGLREFIRETYIQISIVTTLLCVFVTLFADRLMTMIFGADFSGIGLLLIGYVVSNSIMVIRTPLNVILRTRERTYPIFYGIMAGAAATLLLSNICIRRFDINGAVLTLVIANALCFFWLLHWAIKVMRRKAPDKG